MSAHALRRALLVLVAAQAAICAYQHTVFFEEMFRFPSRLSAGVPPGAGSSLPLLLGVLALGWLWTSSNPSGSAFAAASLAHVALLGLSHYAVGLATGRLVPGLGAAVLAASAATALATRRAGRRGEREGMPPFSAWDALSAAFLCTLLIPAAFPYIHFDARVIWAWRAYAMRSDGFVAAVTGVTQPGYPPLFSILLWLGVGDPLFEGRLLPWLCLILFAVFLRARLARISAVGAAPALLFLLATVHVWQGAAMYYADVPLMVFLSTGSLLVLGIPRGEDARSPTAAELASGTLCLMAAVLLRPDGIYYLAVVAGIAAWARFSGGRDFALWPFAVAVAVFATWVLRPAALRVPGGGFLFEGARRWLTAGPTPASAFFKTIGIFLFSLQGQWLSHKGLGVALYGAALVALWRVRGRSEIGVPPGAGDTRVFGAVTFASLLAVAFCYAVIPFTSDVQAAVQPFPGDWAACYTNFVRVGLGRMTIHLYPFLVLYVLAAAAKPEAGGGDGAPC
ncbi:MAG: hypothetical protein ACHQM4_04700 [Thermoanaerobaculia bacterium]